MVRAVELPGSRRQTSDVGGMGRNAATVAQPPSRYLRRRGDVMGCTSSTQHLHTPTSTQHKTMNDEVKAVIEADDVLTEINTVKNENKGVQSRIEDLPTCDKNNTANDVIQLAEESTTLELIENIKDEFETKKDYTENRNDTTVSENHSEAEDRLATLEEVVEKVVELYVDGHGEADEPSVAQSEQELHLTKTTPSLTENKFEENTKEEEERQDTASPSESASSRATRWEALADIAAELPPSLAVDPLTGQIYVLSK